MMGEVRYSLLHLGQFSHQYLRFEYTGWKNYSIGKHKPVFFQPVCCRGRVRTKLNAAEKFWFSFAYASCHQRECAEFEVLC
jgi:hypothetical protein